MFMRSPILRRFMRRKLSVVAAIVLFLFILVATIGPLLCTQNPTDQNLTLRYAEPSAEHWLGTDDLGRDVFTRMVYGARVSFFISFTGVLMGSVIGIILGLCAGYFGKSVDAVISRMIDILLAFPGLLLAILIVAILGNGTENTAIAIAIFSIPSIARMVRSIVIANRDTEYIQAAHVMGSSDLRIMLTHVLPCCISQITVNMTLNFGTAILTASSLSFLGLGVQPPAPEWGAMLASAREVIRTVPRAMIIPGVAITMVVLSFSLVGDGLRDALDPKLKNS